MIDPIVIHMHKTNSISNNNTRQYHLNNLIGNLDQEVLNSKFLIHPCIRNMLNMLRMIMKLSMNQLALEALNKITKALIDNNHHLFNKTIMEVVAQHLNIRITPKEFCRKNFDIAILMEKESHTQM